MHICTIHLSFVNLNQTTLLISFGTLQFLLRDSISTPFLPLRRLHNDDCCNCYKKSGKRREKIQKWKAAAEVVEVVAANGELKCEKGKSGCCCCWFHCHFNQNLCRLLLKAVSNWFTSLAVAAEYLGQRA